MRKFLLLIYLSFSFVNAQISIKGKITSNGNALENIEVINITKRINSKSDINGFFSIDATDNDEIVFYHKKYVQRKLKVTNNLFLSNDIVIKLNERAIELDEVEVFAEKKIKIDVSYDALTQTKIEKEARSPKVVGVNTGEIANGVDLIGVGKKIAGLFKDKKKKEKKDKASLKTYVKKNLSEHFFTNDLKLPKDKIAEFVEYCEHDEESQIVLKKNGVLDVMQYLIKKRKDFYLY